MQFLAYKAQEPGRELIAVDPRHTSRICAACGHNANRARPGGFRCQTSGHQAQADVNAAINILRVGQARRQQREAHPQSA
ncbi:MAG: transposase [Acidimicrobiales bacterium]